MTDRIFAEMTEATRLTRTGNLAEATALIQRRLQGRDSAKPTATTASTIIDAESVTVEAAVLPSPTPDERDDRIVPKHRTGLGKILRGLVGRVMPADLDIGTGRAPGIRPDVLPDGAFATASYTSTAGSRAYKLYVPANRTGQQLPLIVMLHGCTQSPDDFAAGTRMNEVAEEYGCFVAYPAQCASANPQKCWNWFTPDHQRRDQGEPALIAGITRQIMRDHPVDPGRVYVAGLSAGGAAASIMGAAYPDLYAAIAVHSGLPSGAARDLPSAFAAMRQGAAGNAQGPRAVPTIVFHGDQDATVHRSNGDALVAQSTASAAGLQSTVQHGQASGGRTYSRTVYADSSGQAICEQWMIHGAGHAWAGGSPSGSYTDPRGPDATREMLRFFFEHRLT